MSKNSQAIDNATKKVTEETRNVPVRVPRSLHKRVNQAIAERDLGENFQGICIQGLDRYASEHEAESAHGEPPEPSEPLERISRQERRFLTKVLLLRRERPRLGESLAEMVDEMRKD